MLLTFIGVPATQSACVKTSCAKRDVLTFAYYQRIDFKLGIPEVHPMHLFQMFITHEMVDQRWWAFAYEAVGPRFAFTFIQV